MYVYIKIRINANARTDSLRRLRRPCSASCGSSWCASSLPKTLPKTCYITSIN